jgi:hypothetical protein
MGALLDGEPRQRLDIPIGTPHTPTKRGVRVLSGAFPPGRERRAGWRTKSGVVKKGNEEGQPTATSAARQPPPLDAPVCLLVIISHANDKISKQTHHHKDRSRPERRV